MEQSETIINNRYKVVKELGEGGMSRVFLCNDLLSVDTTVALKKINPCILTEGSVQDFRSEFEVMTRLKHPNLISVFDLGVDTNDAIPFITMDYLNGQSLHDFIRDKLTTEQIKEIIVPLFQSLSFIHSRGIIHRDINTQNIVILDTGVPVLMDFGLADLNSSDQRSKGTLGYMAPENFTHNSTFGSDVYAMGLVLFELITKESFFGNTSTQEIITTLRSRRTFLEHRERMFNLIDNENYISLLENLITFEPEERFTAPEAIKGLSFDSDSVVLETDETKEAYVLGAEFIGRGKEFLKVKRRVSTDSHSFSPLWVKGEAGVGKSRLFRELRSYCQMSNVLFFESSCYDCISKQAAPIISLLNEMLFLASDDLIKKYGPVLKRKLPHHKNLERIHSFEPQDPNTEYHMFVSSAVGFFIDFYHCVKCKYVLYINDVQWVDEATVKICDLLVKRLEKEDGDVNNAFKLFISSRLENLDTILTMKTVELFDIIYLEPFTLSGVNEYIYAIFGKDYIGQSLLKAIPQIYERIGGNVFYLQEILKSMVLRNVVFRNVNLWELTAPIDSISFPQSIGDTVLERIKRMGLSPEEWNVLFVLSLLHNSSSEQELNLITSCDNGTLRRLVDSEVLKEEVFEETKYYSFSHNLIEEAVKESCEIKESIHEKIGEIFEKFEDEKIEELAFHYYHAGNNEKGKIYLKKSIDYLLGQHEEPKAIKQIDLYLELLGEEDLEERCRVMDQKGILNGDTGHWDVAESIFEECYSLALNLEDNKAILAEIVAFLALAAIHTRRENTEELLDEALNRYKELEDIPGIIRSYNLLGLYNLNEACNDEKAFTYLSEGLQIAEEHGDERGIAYTMGNLSQLHYRKGEFEKAVNLNKKTFLLFTKVGTPSINLITNNLFQGFYYFGMKEYDKALSHLEQLEKKALEVCSYSMAAGGLALKSEIYLEQKNSDYAVKSIEKAVSLLDEFDDPGPKFHVKVVEPQVKYLAGQKQEALQLLSSLLEETTVDDDLCEVYYQLWRMFGDESHRHEALTLFEKKLQRAYHFQDEKKCRELQSGVSELTTEVEDENTSLLNEELEEVSTDDMTPEFSSWFDEFREDERRVQREVFNFIQKNGEKFLQKQMVKLNNKICEYQKKHEEKTREFDPQYYQNFLGDFLSVICELNSIHSIELLLEKIVHASIKFLNAERGAIFLEDDEGILELKTAFDSAGNKLEDFYMSHTVEERMKRSSEVLFIPDLIDESLIAVSKSIVDMDLRSIMCAVLQNNELGDNLGVIAKESLSFRGLIYLDSKSTSLNGLSSNNIQLLQALADQASGAIKNSLLKNELKNEIISKTIAEEEVRELNEHLEEKVKLRTEELEKAHKNIVENAYKAGMAEIASEVIHNTGNVLTSVVSSSQLIQKIMYNSKIDKLVKINQVIQDTGGDLTGLMSSEPERAKKMCAYYMVIGDLLEKDKNNVMDLLKRLDSKTVEIQKFIAAQQEYAKPAALDLMDINQILEDALEMVEDKILRNNVVIRRVFKEVPRVKGYKIKLVHVFINIMSNAIDAMRGVENDKVMTISLFKEKECVYITIKDMGCGILPQNIKKIFTHGFTTKDDGHGFGLHSSANYIKEMGGEIEATSDGEGKGATFIISFDRKKRPLVS